MRSCANGSLRRERTLRACSRPERRASAEFAKVRCAGPAIALSLAVALLAALTLTPALLRLFGRAAFWPQARMREQANDKAWKPLSNSTAFPATDAPARTPFWDWISQ